ncbi:hypothetical protein [uncultured Ligilactobacillus sp.]|uniref:hypothetical protein n=1 Tax=uncultured Ligilactobacillus sp. TaxID=2837633 RepID=UPI00272B8752|nr:hypothetical protein [uncultured Ligilactobacillus sp.]
MKEEMRTAIKARLELFPNIKAIIGKLDEAILNSFIEDALNQVEDDGFTEKNIVMGAAYLTAHFCYVASNENSNIQEQTAAVLTVKYFDRGGSDDYLTEYLRLKRALKTNTSSIRFL